MKKRAVVLGILILCLGIFLPMVFAQENITQTEDDEQAKVDKAYACLQGKTTEKCSTLTSEQRIFTLLATGECREEVISDSEIIPASEDLGEQQCWPKNGCNVKATSQAILALKNLGIDTSSAEEWLLEQRISPSDMKWFLQIDSTSSEAMACTIGYDISDTNFASVSITVNADKTINEGGGDASNCFSTSSNYWLEIRPNCYDKEFRISCTTEGSFLTTLFFKGTSVTSSSFHVLEKVNTGSGGETTIEEINSLCFKKGNSCDYEGSLWASVVLNQLDYSISPYLPYLVTMADESINLKFLPNSFLYLLTGDIEFLTKLIQKQIGGKYWSASGDKIYGTAVALFSLMNEDIQEKKDSKIWLLEQQDDDGCFGGIKNTAFVLYSVWPRAVSGVGGEEEISCSEAGLFCMSQVDCVGNIVDTYSCPGISRCCDTEKPLETCIAQQGDTCSSDQICVGGVTIEALGLDYGASCCTGGACEVPVEIPEVSECESNSGFCRATGCEENEEESVYACSFGDTCCIEKTAEEKKSYWWIWLLLFLIVLVVLGIIFRDKLRPLYLRIKNKFDSIFKKKTGPPGRPPFGRRPGGPPPRMPPPRFGPPTGRPGAKPPGDVNDVLKKLKEMGK